MDDLEEFIYRCVERVMAGRYSERHGLVTSYDPTNHLAKVTFQPEGQESGWLPIETGHIGNGYGIAIGLTPGNGMGADAGGSTDQSAANYQGDQVIVRYQEGDFESGKIVQRVHSQDDAPPTVQSGEIVVWQRQNNKIFFDQKGNLLVQGAGKVSGNDQADNQLQNTNTPKQTITLKNDGSIVIDCPTNDLTVTVDQTNVNVTAKQNINLTATTENVNIVASAASVNITGQQDINLTATAESVNIEAASGAVNVGAENVAVTATESVTVTASENVTVDPGPGTVYVGGNPSGGGVFGNVMTEDGPATNVQARVG
jgi:hypothetical protein